MIKIRFKILALKFQVFKLQRKNNYFIKYLPITFMTSYHLSKNSKYFLKNRKYYNFKLMFGIVYDFKIQRHKN